MNYQNVHILGELPEENSLIVHGGCCNIIDGSSPNDESLKKSRHLSEFITELDKALARKNLGIPDKFQLRWGNIEGNLDQQKDLYNVLTKLQQDIDDLGLQIGNTLAEEINKIKILLETKISKELSGNQASTQIAYNNLDYPHMKTIKDALDQVLYKDLIITLSCQPNIAEEGSTVSFINYKWNINKDIILSQTFDGIQLSTSAREYTLSGNFSSNTTKTLTVDDGTKQVSKSVTLSFYPGLYYGVSNKDSLTTEDITKFGYKLLASRQTTITANADLSSYIYICIPYDYGEASFKVGGFEGGFELIDDSFVFNKYKNIRYRIYRSDNKGLGATTITIL